MPRRYGCNGQPRHGFVDDVWQPQLLHSCNQSITRIPMNTCVCPDGYFESTPTRFNLRIPLCLYGEVRRYRPSELFLVVS
jgi:hypothetical protein